MRYERITYFMNSKTNSILMQFFKEKMKIFFSKINRNPNYYVCKHYNKINRKDRNHDNMW